MNLKQALKFDALPFVVECTEANGPTRWEPLAAFNVDVIAEKYAKDCGESNPRLIYRVLTCSHPEGLGGWLEILRVEKGTFWTPYPRGKTEIPA